jgi:NMD protein affecting ribosome stability and mRNA decay
MAKSSSQTGDRRGARRWGRAQLDNRKDPYRPGKKMAEPAVCPDCGAVFHRGRWQWSAAPEEAISTRCEACRRIRDGFSAGILTVVGELTPAKVAEMEALARHQEKAEMTEHPLNRIMAIERPNDVTMIITTTDLHLPRRIARALKDAFGGHFDEHYEKNGGTVRIAWQGD